MKQEANRIVDGWLRLSLNNTLALIEAGHEVEPSQFEPNIPDSEQARRHQLDIVFIQHRLEARYGLAEFLEIGVEQPFRMTIIDATFSDAEGNELTDFSSVHHRDEVVAGVADPSLKIHWHALSPKTFMDSRLVVSVGLGFPLGETEENPFQAGMEGRDHQHMFFGYGIFTPRAGLRWTQPFSDWSFSIWSDSIFSFYENGDGYQPPSTHVMGTGAQSSFGLESWWFGVEPRLMFEVAAMWDGQRAENSGRTDVLGALMAGVSLGSGWSLSGDVQTTLASFSQRGNQMTLPLIGVLSVFWGAPIGPSSQAP